jgi:pyruvate-formate lyase
MEHRIQQLELKLAEQEQVNAGLRDDIKSLKEIQYGNRTEYLKGFEHYEQKKKKFAGVLEEANKSMSALQDQQELLATKEELQYATQIMLLLSDQANIG